MFCALYMTHIHTHNLYQSLIESAIVLLANAISGAIFLFTTQISPKEYKHHTNFVTMSWYETIPTRETWNSNAKKQKPHVIQIISSSQTLFLYTVFIVLLFTQVNRTALSWDIVEFFTFHRILVVFTLSLTQQKKNELDEWERKTKAQRCEWERCTIPIKLPFVSSSWHHFEIWDCSVTGPFLFARYFFLQL